MSGEEDSFTVCWLSAREKDRKRVVSFCLKVTGGQREKERVREEVMETRKGEKERQEEDGL